MGVPVAALPSPEPSEAGTSGQMPFLDHLDELRKRLIVSVISVLVGFLIAFAFRKQILAFIMVPLQAVLPSGQSLIYTGLTEAFFLEIKASALAGLVLAVPAITSQIWLFVAPGLYAKEKRIAIPFVVFASLFFLAGTAFSHFVAFPWAWSFFSAFDNEFLEFLPQIGPLFSTYVRFLLAFGAVFQIPTVVFFLSRMGMITPRFLMRNFKYAVLIVFIIAAVLTPTSDPVGQALMAGPMIALYGLSIVIAWVFGKKEEEP